jgi:hypothetical protein
LVSRRRTATFGRGRGPDLARLFGVPVGEQLHGALEIGEEDRDLLPLAFERSLGPLDLLGKVLGCVDVRRNEAL